MSLSWRNFCRFLEHVRMWFPFMVRVKTTNHKQILLGVGGVLGEEPSKQRDKQMSNAAHSQRSLRGHALATDD